MQAVAAGTGGGAWQVLSDAGRAALRSIVPLALVLGYGLLNAKDITGARLQAVAFAVSAAIVIFTTLQSLVPALSWRNYVPEAYAKYLDAATQAFLGTFVSLILGFLAAPDWSTWRSFVTGALVAAGTAVVRALQSLFTPGEPVLDPQKEPQAPKVSALSTSPTLKTV
jgi:hypothetical protein